MELFRLLGTIAVNNSGANEAIDDTTDKAEKSKSKISGAFEKIGGAAVKLGKVAAVGLATAVTAITALTASALSGYADYEQLVGGVETLFGTGGKSIEEYAISVGKTVSEVEAEYNNLMSAQEMVQSTLVYTAASIAAAIVFTAVAFGLGNGKISAMICMMIAVVLKFVCTEMVSKLYPASGECALTGAKYNFFRFVDQYVPFSYFNGGVRYEMKCYVLGCITTIGVALLAGLMIFQKKDMK